MRDIEPTEELFAKYGQGYYKSEEGPLPDPHILSDDEYASRLSEIDNRHFSLSLFLFLICLIVLLDFD